MLLNLSNILPVMVNLSNLILTISVLEKELRCHRFESCRSSCDFNSQRGLEKVTQACGFFDFVNGGDGKWDD